MATENPEFALSSVHAEHDVKQLVDARGNTKPSPLPRKGEIAPLLRAREQDAAAVSVEILKSRTSGALDAATLSAASNLLIALADHAPDALLEQIVVASTHGALAMSVASPAYCARASGREGSWAWGAAARGACDSGSMSGRWEVVAETARRVERCTRSWALLRGSGAGAKWAEREDGGPSHMGRMGGWRDGVSPRSLGFIADVESLFCLQRPQHSELMPFLLNTRRIAQIQPHALHDKRK